MNTLFAALLNGVISGIPVAALVWLALRCAPSRTLNAATRYVVWWATLAVVIVLPAVYLSIPHSHNIDPPPVQIRSSDQIDVVPVRSEPTVVTARTSGTKPRSLGFPVEVNTGTGPEWVALAWTLLTGLLLLRLAVSYILLGRCKARSCPAPAVLAARLEVWLQRSGCDRGVVRLAVSDEISTPMAAGPSHPSILMPTHLLAELQEDELDQIGLHEAAHLARGDDYTLLLERVLQAVFALHPVVRFILRQIDLDREVACDDFVVQASKHPRR